jgi:death on curing protein
MSDPIWIDRKALEDLHGRSLQEFGGPSGIRDDNLFESALARPQNLYAYTGVNDVPLLAASYAFGLAKNHAFVDGNKRVAFHATVLFLALNGFRLQADHADIILKFFALAAGDVTEDQLATWIRDHMVPR